MVHSQHMQRQAPLGWNTWTSPGRSRGPSLHALQQCMRHCAMLFLLRMAYLCCGLKNTYRLLTQCEVYTSGPAQDLSACIYPCLPLIENYRPVKVHKFPWFPWHLQPAKHLKKDVNNIRMYCLSVVPAFITRGCSNHIVVQFDPTKIPNPGASQKAD
jgi:hypothetical protein